MGRPALTPLSVSRCKCSWCSDADFDNQAPTLLENSNPRPRLAAQIVKSPGRQRKRYQVLMYPVTDSSMSQPSYEEFANGPWLTRAAMAWFWDAYAPNNDDRKKTTASPLSATLEQLKGLPPVLVIVDENDILRDEGEQYARKLMQAGVDVTPLRVLATHHDYALLNALAGTPATKVTVEVASKKLSEALGSKRSAEEPAAA